MSQVKYLHVRHSQKLPNGKTTINPHGGITYAYVEQHGVVVFGVAKCSPKDNFVKAYGRAKAAGRMLSDKHRAIFFGTGKDFRATMHNLGL